MVTKTAILNPASIIPSLSPDHIGLSSYTQIADDASHSQVKDTVFSNDFDAADIILAPSAKSVYGYRFHRLLHSNLYQEYQRKIVIYCADDLFHLNLPGLYPACRKNSERDRWALPAHYRLNHLPKWRFTPEELAGERSVFFSFVGSVRNHPIRSILMGLTAPNTVLQDSSPDQQWWKSSIENQKAATAFFREQLLRSQFVLCPKGIIDASIRLFEAMEAGAVPVVIADNLCLPHGPNWDQCILRVVEKDIPKIPQILKDRQDHVSAMGRNAREAWEDYFSPQSSFASLSRWACELIERKIKGYPFRVRAWAAAGAFLRPKTLRIELSDIRYTFHNKIAGR